MRPGGAHRAGGFAGILVSVTAVAGLVMAPATAAAAAPVTTAAAAAPVTMAAPAAVASAQAAVATGVNVWHQPRLTALVAEARRMTTMHIPYSAGGHGPTPPRTGSSVDCSGLVRMLYFDAFGVDIGRGTGDSMVRRSGLFVRTSHPVPGDVILFGHGGSAPAFHEMIYVGEEGGHPLAVGSPDYGEYIKYQHPDASYWTGDLMGYWHFRGATAADSLPSLARPHSKVGLDWARTGDGTVHVYGWAFDPVNPQQPVIVDIYDGDRRIGTLTADRCRADVDSRYRVGCRHGFWGIFDLPVGVHRIRALAGHVPGDGVYNLFSRARTMTVTRDTRAHIWKVTPGVGTLTVYGFGLDRRAVTTPGRFDILVDGHAAVTGAPTIVSAGVNRVYRTSGKHAFRVTVPVAPGAHTVQVRVPAVDRYSRTGTSAGTRAAPLTSRPHSKVGLDWAKSGDGTVHVYGWAFDPTAPWAAVIVDVYDGARRVATLTADRCRADVDRTFGVGCSHGFWGIVRLEPGPHRIRVLAGHVGANGAYNTFSPVREMTVTRSQT